MVFTSTTPWKPTNVKIFQEVRNWRNWILSVPIVSVCRETKSPWLRQYQSYISNLYVNEKVFTSTTTWEPRNLIFFFKKVRNWIWLVFWLVLKSWNHSGMHRRPFEGRHLVTVVTPSNCCGNKACCCWHSLFPPSLCSNYASDLWTHW